MGFCYKDVINVLIATLTIFLLTVSAGCAHVIRYDGDYEGKVIDADTKEPLKGVVVVGIWYKIYPNVAGANYEFYDAKETKTDGNGEFSISGMGLRIFSNIEPMDVLIFKAGYEHIGLCLWESLKKDPIRRKKIKWVGNKAIISLKKWNIKERLNRLGSYYVDIPAEKQKLLLQELEKENKEIGR